MLANSETLTTAEKLLLIRSRTGITQTELAKLFETTKYQYRKVETDPNWPVGFDPELVDRITQYVDQNWSEPASAAELLKVERVRAKLTTHDAAEVVGYCRAYWMIIEGGGRPVKQAPAFQKAIHDHAAIYATAKSR